MKPDDLQVYTIVKIEQDLIEETFPFYTTCLGFGMYAMHYFIVYVFLGLSDQSLVLDRIIWMGTYITPYIFHFWILAAISILIVLFFRDYRKGIRQIKLEPNQITLYPKQKDQEPQVLSFEHSIQTIFLPEKNTSFKIDTENRSLLLPSTLYSPAILKIAQFYDAKLVKEETNDKSEFQDED